MRANPHSDCTATVVTRGKVSAKEIKTARVLGKGTKKKRGGKKKRKKKLFLYPLCTLVPPPLLHLLCLRDVLTPEETQPPAGAPATQRQKKGGDHT